MRAWPLEAAAAVPAHVARPPFVADAPLHVKDGAEAAALRAAGRLAASLLHRTCARAAVGVTTAALDAWLQEEAVAAGAYPSPLHYRGFPRASCTSANEVVCHGIPDARPLQAGDLLNVDVTLYVGGVHADTSHSFLLPTHDVARATRVRRILHAAARALQAGLLACRPGARVSHIAAAIDAVAAEERVGVVPELLGHGIGHHFHEAPFIFHTGPVPREYDVELEPGMVFTVEPCITEGSPEIETWDDGWTIVTKDGGLSAVFEHTLIITSTGHEILTPAPDDVHGGQ